MQNQQLKPVYQLTTHIVNEKTLLLSYEELRDFEQQYKALLSTSLYVKALEIALDGTRNGYAYIDCID